MPDFLRTCTVIAEPSVFQRLIQKHDTGRTSKNYFNRHRIIEAEPGNTITQEPSRGTLSDPTVNQRHWIPAFRGNDINYADLLRASRSARQSLSGVTGMSRLSTPAGRTALRIAFMVAPSAPDVPDSPTPLAPRALAFVGTACSSQRIARIQSARGMG